MWIVTLVVATGIAALTYRCIQVRMQRDQYADEYYNMERSLIEAWDIQSDLMDEIALLQQDNQYLQETIAYWVEDRMSDSQWDNGRLPTNDTYANYDSPF
jgi:septal ring factor EnvC (AmiA/AmiB activator)